MEIEDEQSAPVVTRRDFLAYALGERMHRAEPGWIVATGPHAGDCTAQGYVFPTDLPDQAHAILSRDIMPFRYAYLLVWRGWITLAACSLQPRLARSGSRERAAAAFARAVPGLDLGRARSCGGSSCRCLPCRCLSKKNGLVEHHVQRCSRRGTAAGPIRGSRTRCSSGLRRNSKANA